MVSVARKNLLSDKGRFFVSVGGVGFSIFLILYLLGMLNAFRELSTAYVKDLDADILVSQEGIKDTYHYPSLLEESKIKQVARVSDGNAEGLISWITNVKVSESDGSKIIDFPGRKVDASKNGKAESMIVVGFDTSTGFGGPQIILRGCSSPGKKEIIVDRTFTEKDKLDIGDQIEIFNQIYTICGVTDNNNILTFTRSFVSMSDAQDTFGLKGKVNFILVKVPSPDQAQAAKDKIEKSIPGISVFIKNEFVAENAKLIDESFTPIIAVIAVIGFATGAIVVGLTIYTATMEKIKEYGVMKAIGISNRQLFLIVFEQSLWSTILGYFLGCILVFSLRTFITSLVPIIVVSLNIGTLLFGAVASILMSFISSYIPIRRISNIDPEEIFR